MQLIFSCTIKTFLVRKFFFFIKHCTQRKISIKLNELYNKSDTKRNITYNI